ncbi:hypothetical protein SOVF_034820 isoform B [Spinacia oleracea]|uniref:Zinc finger CCCH domain-containing protein 19 isoform X2 n=1 Tax=Spinacia oleracea TaxID=3562 RepID=A0A9R0INW4_SPIOL|nr:zinc finger CCCH domain-containing protein 19 isoform X2 [Spinacia oleracea]KNA22355.1 hypothetical protein SOVF_034820 isoform B [Spinacia oleracea]
MEELEMNTEKNTERGGNKEETVEEPKQEDVEVENAGGEREDIAAVDDDVVKMEELELITEEVIEEKGENRHAGEEVMVKEEEDKEELEKVQEVVGEEGQGVGEAEEEEEEEMLGEEGCEEEVLGEEGCEEKVLAEEVGEEKVLAEDEKAVKEEGGKEAEKGEELVGGEEEAGGEREEIAAVDDNVVEMEEMELKTEEVTEEKAENRNNGEEGSDEVMLKEEEEKGELEKVEDVVGEGGRGCGEAEKDEVVVGEEEGEEKVLGEGGEEEVVGEEGGEEMEDSASPVVGKDDKQVREDETPIADTEMEMETEVGKSGSGSGSGGKRRRGRSSKATTPVKTPARKTVGEDVCFVCLDGGDLVLCDRRGCPKAYHPSCVDHDDEFFQTKGRWNCGWHLCNQCGKNAYFLCYTCTFSLCKGCSKDAAVFCVRGSKGFCDSCMKTVMVIESSEQNEMGRAAFDDKSSWNFLFKDYWIEQKGKLCITSDELAQAKNPWRDSDATGRRQAPVELHEGNNDAGTDSDSSHPNLEVTDSRRTRAKRKSKPVDSGTDSSTEKEAGTVKRKSKRRPKAQSKEELSDSEDSSGNQDSGNKRGKRARRLSKSRSRAGNGRISVEGNTEWASKELLEFVMHMKDGDNSVLTQFDVQGLLLEYIKRNKLRDPRRQSQILCDSMLQKLFGKPRVGHFEMLKLLESHFLLKEDSHVDDNQGSVVDTEISQLDADDADYLLESGKSKGKKSRKRGEERGQSNLDDYAAIDMHNINLICLRRCLMEALMDDSEMFHDKVVGSFVRIRISGSSQKQDIYRLVQIIGTSKAPEPYKVGKRTTDDMLEILNLDKTEIVSIDSISNQEFTEDECKRLRQSIKCGLISRMTVGDIMEKARELQEVRVIDWLEAEIVRLSHLRDRASEKGRKKELRECVEKLQLLKTPEERQRRLNEIPEVHADPKMDPSCVSDDETEKQDKRQGNMRPRESGSFRRGRDAFSPRKGGSVSNDSWSASARPPNKSWEPGRNTSNKGFSGRRDDTALSPQKSEHTWSSGIDKGTPRSNSWEKPRSNPDTLMSTRAEHSGTRSDFSVAAASEPTQPLSSAVGQTDGKINDTDKIWHYRDPSGKVQGPFSIAQLRKWNNTGYFPVALRVWRASQTEDDAIVLTEALAGRFQKVGSHLDVGSNIRNSSPLMGTPKPSGARYDSSNLPSPTPGRSPAAWSGKQTSTNQLRGNERLPSPTPISPASDPSGADRSKVSEQSKGELPGNKQENVTASIGTFQHAPGQYVSHSATVNAQQISSQSVLHVANQPFVPPDTAVSVGSNALGTGQGFPNMIQPGTVQNPPVYTQNWGAGYVARPEMVNTNLTTSNNQNALPAQVAYSQWSGVSVNNQASPYASGYPSGQGNIAANFPVMPANNAWRPAQTHMPWGGHQQQPVNQNVGWAGQPAAVAMGQMTSPAPSGPATVGWTGTGPSPAAGSTNMVWVGAPGNTGTWGGDQNRNSGGAQWNRQSSGSGGQRGVCIFHENGHCRKGSSCDFMHN